MAVIALFGRRTSKKVEKKGWLFSQAGALISSNLLVMKIRSHLRQIIIWEALANMKDMLSACLLKHTKGFDATYC